MPSLALGPIALPLLPLSLLLAVLLASRAAPWLGRKQGLPEQESEGLATYMFLCAAAGMLGARVVHVGQFLDLYLQSPLDIIDLRDGGWNVPAGCVVSMLVLGFVLVRPEKRGRRDIVLPLLAATGLGTTIWLGALIAVQLQTPGRMPDLELLRLDGRSLRLSEQTLRQASVIHLWASWCGPCRAEMPVFLQVQRDHPDVRFVYVNQGETFAAIERYVRQQALEPGNVLIDGNSELGRRVGSSSLPTTLFYRADGTLNAMHRGPLNQASLRAKLRALQRSSPASPATPGERSPSNETQPIRSCCNAAKRTSTG